MTEQQACCAKRYEVTHADLPLSCPMPEYRLWDAHPCVYLPIQATGQAVCPYCGAEYLLIDYEPEYDNEQSE
ncbi:MAG TPA: zinc-finger domain-containing protein [Gammaproteobacteria bacterium]|nr:zinc-finger domain-containing protein [Gammaproteobacteria bacterium]